MKKDLPLFQDILPVQRKLLEKFLTNPSTSLQGNILSIALQQSELEVLPGGYFYKGGSARETLRSWLFKKKLETNHIRDFDIFRYAETPDTLDHQISLRFMRDDYEFGHGIEVLESEQDYFSSRDLSINEVLVGNKRISCTIACLDDMLNGILRPTESVCYSDGSPKCDTAAKLLRLAATRSHGIEWRIEMLPLTTPLSPFYLALNLDRSFSINRESAENYLRLASAYQAMPPQLSSSPSMIECIQFLCRYTPKGINFFSHLPQEIVEDLAGSPSSISPSSIARHLP